MHRIISAATLTAALVAWPQSTAAQAGGSCWDVKFGGTLPTTTLVHTKQGDWRWAASPFGSSCGSVAMGDGTRREMERFGDCGCFPTSIANLGNFIGLVLKSQDAFYQPPGTDEKAWSNIMRLPVRPVMPLAVHRMALASWRSSSDPMSAIADKLGFYIRPLALSSAFVDVLPGSLGQGLAFVPRDWMYRSEIDEQLAACKPVILIHEIWVERELPDGSKTKEYGGNHAVLAVGWDDGEGKNRVPSYLVVDPADAWDPSNPVTPPIIRSLSSTVGADWEDKMQGFVTWKRVTATAKSLEIDAHSPIELLATDPLGRRIGLDVASGRYLAEVPDAGYARALFPTGAGAGGELPKKLTVLDPIEGLYALKVVGTGEGLFTLIVRGTSHTGEVETITTGYAVPGMALDFRVVLDPAGTGSPQVTPGVNVPPFARTGRSQEYVYAGHPVAFDGGASFDLDGAVASQAWDFGDGSTASGAQAVHIFGSPGEYDVTLTVVDDAGGTSVAHVHVVAYDPSSRPSLGGLQLIGQGFDTTANGQTDVAISGDGTIVVAARRAYEDRTGDLYVFDTVRGVETEVIDDGFGVAISADGRWVAFGRMVPVGGGSRYAIVVRDRGTGQEEIASVDSSGAVLPASYGARISDDGRFVLFFMWDGGSVVYGLHLRDRVAGTTTRLDSVETFVREGERRPPYETHPDYDLSADGRIVTWTSPWLGAGDAKCVAAGQTGACMFLYTLDRSTGAVERWGIATPGYNALGFPRLSGDGRYVAYRLDGNPDSLHRMCPSSWQGYLYRRDLLTGAVDLVSRTPQGKGVNKDSRYPEISFDGRSVAFWSEATNLIPEEAHCAYAPDPATIDTCQDPYRACNCRWECGTHQVEPSAFLLTATGQTAQLDVSDSGTQALRAGPPVLSDDGRTSAFTSCDPALWPAVTLDGCGLFARRQPGVESPPPISVAGGPYIGWANALGSPAGIAFDASGSLSPSGDPLTATWDFGDGSPPVTESAGTPVHHGYSAAGTFTATVSVTDGVRTSAVASANVQILDPIAPLALTITPACGQPGDEVRIGAGPVRLAPSADGWNLALGDVRLPSSLGTEVAVRVRKGGSEVAAAAAPVVSVSGVDPLAFTRSAVWAVPDTLAAGAFEVEVDAAVAAFAIPCPAPGPSQAVPVADAGGPYSAKAGEMFTLDGSRSFDPASGELTFAWRFLDGTVATGPNPGVSIADVGTHAVFLSVTGANGPSLCPPPGRCIAMVTITQAAPPPPETSVSETTSSGCGCSTAGNGGMLWLALIALWAAGRRPRPNGRHDRD